MLRPPCLCSSEGHKHGVSKQSSVNLGDTLLQIMREWKTAGNWFLARLFIYQSSIVSQTLDFFHWMKIGVQISIFDFFEYWKLEIEDWYQILIFVFLKDWKLKFDVEFQFSFFWKLKIENLSAFSVQFCRKTVGTRVHTFTQHFSCCLALICTHSA